LEKTSGGGTVEILVEGSLGVGVEQSGPLAYPGGKTHARATFSLAGSIFFLYP